jgi:2-C-methyl-D-erythritol 4-phosphate cytidylyltransferase
MTAMHNRASGSYAGVVLAAGSGTRLGHRGSKAYLPLCGTTMLVWGLATLARTGGVGRLVLAARAQDLPLAEAVLARELPEVAVELVAGGPRRHDSEHRVLTHLAADIRSGAVTAVLLHDAARPLASMELAERVLAAASERGAAVPGVPVEHVVGVDDAGRLLPPGAERLVSIQTPQAFRAGALLDAYEAAARDGFAGTDTAASIERYTDLEVAVVPGEPGNLKITFADDLLVAERLLRRQGAPAVSPARSPDGRARPGTGSR